MSKLILLNGPLLCGKTAAVDYLKQFFPLVDRRCKDKLFELTYSIFGLNKEEFFRIYEDRDLKELPMRCFAVTTEAFHLLEEEISLGRVANIDSYMQNLSCREAMIFVSECVTKPNLGDDYFGKFRAESILDCEIAIDDSAGFVDELQPAIDKLRMENILLIRIKGRGDFQSNDSRGWIPDGVITIGVDIYNEGTEEEFLKDVKVVVEAFICS